jgi:hypothetical protein
LADSDKKLSLYRAITAGGYEASLVGTYAINFPFYERVVLKRLQAAGCRHNIVLVDGGQCGRALASELTAPQLSGADYLLLPIQSAGAFHPKFVMLLGRRGARLILGSHNLTLAGFGLNREIATSFSCAPDDGTAAAARRVWRFVREWSAEFPRRIVDVVAATERIAPWLLAADDAPPSSPLVLGAAPTGLSLWEQLKPMLAGSVTRVTVVSPYFDARLAFLAQLDKELRPKECVVAVHPKFSELPANARTLRPRTRFVDVSGLAEGWADRYLHAKLYRFDFATGKTIVVLGSANASVPAWLAGADGRNAELVVVHPDGEKLWKSLGLHRLTTAPEMGKQDWAAMAARVASKPLERSAPAPSLAIAVPDGFVVDEPFVEDVGADQIQVVTEGSSTPAIQRIEQGRDEVRCICADGPVRAAAIRLECRLASGVTRVALVQHVSELLDKSAGSLRLAFRRALEMEGDPEQLAELFKVVEKVIFDGQIALETTEKPSRAASSQAGASTEEKEPDTLIISAKETVRARRKRRLAASSDLAVIIDALIYRLGQGLPARLETDLPDSVVSPEGIPDDEDEDGDRPEIDGHAIAKACRGKVNRIFKRMIAQCEAAVARGSDATRAIGQLAAVLGAVKYLRTKQSSFTWCPRGEWLVDPDRQWRFFKDVSRCLYASASGLAAKALAEHDGREFDELTTVRGLLTWLAIDCELDTRHALDGAREEPESVRENLVGIAYLIPVATACASDDVAEQVLSSVAAAQPASIAESAAYHMRWARQVAQIFSQRPPAGAEPIRLGDLVFPLKMAADWPLIVVDAQHNKTGIVDLDTGEPKYFGAGFVARLQV